MRAQLSFVLSQITRLTDGRTDRQTDRILIARPRLHSMQRGKKRDGERSEESTIFRTLSLLDLLTA